MPVKAKFYVSQITKTPSDYVSVVLQPVVRSNDKSNIDWAKYTPSGKIDMNVSTGTGAAAWFEEHLGKDVSITFDEPDDLIE